MRHDHRRSKLGGGGVVGSFPAAPREALGPIVGSASPELAGVAGVAEAREVLRSLGRRGRRSLAFESSRAAALAVWVLVFSALLVSLE